MTVRLAHLLSAVPCLSLLFACAADPPPAATVSSVPQPPVPATSAVAVSAPAPATVPDTPAGHQLTWVLAAMAAAPTEADATTHFTPDFVAHIPVAKVVAIFSSVASAAPFTLESVSPASPVALTAVVRSSAGPRLNVRLSVDPASGLMGMMLLKPKAND
jgi:hypothetical protein